MKIKPVNSDKAPVAVGGYCQAALIERAERLLFISGQIPETKDGQIPRDFEGQCRQVWANLTAQLHAAQMSIGNIVKVTIYLSSRDYAEANSRIRREVLQDHEPALTIIITGIFNKDWLLEIEAVAAS